MCIAMSYANARIFTVRYLGFMKNSIFLTSVNAMFSLVNCEQMRISVLVHNFTILNFAMCCHSNVRKFQLFFPKNLLSFLVNFESASE